MVEAIFFGHVSTKDFQWQLFAVQIYQCIEKKKPFEIEIGCIEDEQWQKKSQIMALFCFHYKNGQSRFWAAATNGFLMMNSNSCLRIFLYGLLRMERRIKLTSTEFSQENIETENSSQLFVSLDILKQSNTKSPHLSFRRNWFFFKKIT